MYRRHFPPAPSSLSREFPKDGPRGNEFSVPKPSAIKLVTASGPQVVTKSDFLFVNSDASRGAAAAIERVARLAILRQAERARSVEDVGGIKAPVATSAPRQGGLRG